ncbi:MAG TPA: transglutaminase-like domain-containing protein [Jiangellales bacterium]|nr:transglutaminase-like domain-containing protein [Jiangellales bacterium]
MSSRRDRFAEVVRAPDVDLGLACLLLAAEEDPDLDVRFWLAALDELAARVPPTGHPPDRLRTALGRFTGAAEDYADLRSSLLPHVLRRRRGLPILLSVVWLEVARRAGIPAYGVGLPGHFVVGVGDPAGYHELADPWRGGRRLRTGEAADLVAATGASFSAGMLRPWEPVEVLQRILANIRHWAGDALERRRTRLWAVELGLLLPRHPAALRRERGELLVRGGDFVGGAVVLEDYAAAVEGADPVAAEATRRTARAARARLN